MDKLKVQELREELQTRGIDVTGKRKKELEIEFDELRRGITNVPALLQGVPEKSLAEYDLKFYEVSPLEPLHDIKGHLSNMIEEIKVLLNGPAKEKVYSICTSVFSKETLRASDIRKGAILILLALQDTQPNSPVTAALESAVEICEILYAEPEKRSPQSVLRLHNITFVHAKLCEKVFSTPRTMSKRKMFGRYYHALTAHSALVNRIISPRLLNAEVEERTFGQCKAITRATSNQHTEHIIKNILVRLHYEKDRSTSTIQTQESEVSKFDRMLPPRRNTEIPLEWMEQSPVHYQAHLERIGDYLIHGNGIWWQFTNKGVEFFDSGSSIPSATTSLHHFRTMSLCDVEYYLLTQWERCLEQGVQLPSKYIRTYSADGNLLEVHQNTNPTVNTPCPVSESHPGASDKEQTEVPKSPSQPGTMRPGASDKEQTEVPKSPSQPGTMRPAASDKEQTEVPKSPSQPGTMRPAASDKEQTEVPKSPSQPGTMRPGASDKEQTEVPKSPSQPGTMRPGASDKEQTEVPKSPSQPGTMRPGASDKEQTEVPKSPPRLSSLSRCILSVVPREMRDKVLAFDILRSKIKSKFRHKVLPRDYQEASLSLRDQLTQQYRMLCSQANQDKHIQHKINVIKRVLKHEWSVTLVSLNSPSDMFNCISMNSSSAIAACCHYLENQKKFLSRRAKTLVYTRRLTRLQKSSQEVKNPA